MKTENEFSEYFLRSAGLQFAFDSEDGIYLQKLAASYWADLTSHLSFYYSHEDRLKITEKAAQLLAKGTVELGLDEAWKNVLRDFNKNQFWGFKSTLAKPKKIRTEEQKIFWKLFNYTWAFFQAMVILKIAVYYFGLESADHPDQTNVGWVWFFFSLSFLSLVFFAYRNRNDKT